MFSKNPFKSVRPTQEEAAQFEQLHQEANKRLTRMSEKTWSLGEDYGATVDAAAHAKKDGANYSDVSVQHKYDAFHMKKRGYTHFETGSYGTRRYTKRNTGGSSTAITSDHHKGISEEAIDEAGYLSFSNPGPLKSKLGMGPNDHKDEHIKQAMAIAKEMGGNMTGATRKIDKIAPNLSGHPKVSDALRLHNEAKLDPVGNEDPDIDNDGDVDKSDKHLHKRRKKIKKAIKDQDKEEVVMNPKLDGSKDQKEGMTYSNIRSALLDTLNEKKKKGKGEHYKSAADAEDANVVASKQGSSKGANDMRDDHYKAPEDADVDAKKTFDADAKTMTANAKVAKPRNPADKTRSGDQKIIPSATPVKDPAAPVKEDYNAMVDAKAHAKKDGANYSDTSVAHKYDAFHMKKRGYTHFETQSHGVRRYTKRNTGYGSTAITADHHKGISEAMAGVGVASDAGPQQPASKQPGAPAQPKPELPGSASMKNVGDTYHGRAYNAMRDHQKAIKMHGKLDDHMHHADAAGAHDHAAELLHRMGPDHPQYMNAAAHAKAASSDANETSISQHVHGESTESQVEVITEELDETWKKGNVTTNLISAYRKMNETMLGSSGAEALGASRDPNHKSAAHHIDYHLRQHSDFGKSSDVGHQDRLRHQVASNLGYSV